MEREANYGLIGGLTLVLLGAAFAFVLWLGQSQFTSDFDDTVSFSTVPFAA